MRLWLIILACASGCFGKSDDTLAPLADTAWTERVPGLKCDHQVTFYEDGKFLDSMICILGDYSMAAQVNKGTFHVNDRTLTVGIDQSSCDTDSSHSVEFAVGGDSLIIYNPSSVGGTVTMTRLIFLPGEPEAGIPIGCFDAETWAFTEMAVHKI